MARERERARKSTYHVEYCKGLVIILECHGDDRDCSHQNDQQRIFVDVETDVMGREGKTREAWPGGVAVACDAIMIMEG